MGKEKGKRKKVKGYGSASLTDRAQLPLLNDQRDFGG
jgi:hypothetical protein